MRLRDLMFVLIMTLGSGAVGYALGGPAEVMYSWDNWTYTGARAGLIAGLAVGVLYSLGMLRISRKRPEKLASRGILYGMAAALTCSTVVHVILMIIWHESFPGAMLFGDVVALVAGLVLGLLGGAYLKRRPGPRLPQEGTSNATS